MGIIDSWAREVLAARVIERAESATARAAWVSPTFRAWWGEWVLLVARLRFRADLRASLSSLPAECELEVPS